MGFGARRAEIPVKGRAATGKVRRLSWRSIVAVTMFAVASLGASGCGGATHRSPAGPPSGSETPAVLAQHTATKMLGEVFLSSPAQRVTSLPADARNALMAEEPTSSVHTARRVELWTTSESPTSLLAVVGREVRKGGTERGDTSSVRGRPDYWSEGFSYPSSAPALREEALRFAVSRLSSDRFAVLGEASVTWRVRRPSYSFIPSANTLAVAVVRRFQEQDGKVRLERSESSIDKPAAINAVRAAANRLPVAEPSVDSCVAGLSSNVQVRLVFEGGRPSKALASVRTLPLPCGPRTWIATVQHHQRTYLEATAAFTTLIEETVGSRARRSN